MVFLVFRTDLFWGSYALFCVCARVKGGGGNGGGGAPRFAQEMILSPPPARTLPNCTIQFDLLCVYVQVKGTGGG